MVFLWGVIVSDIVDNKDYEKIVSDYLALKKPNRKVLSALIDKIIIDEDKNIEIKYKIRTPFLA